MTELKPPVPLEIRTVRHSACARFACEEAPAQPADRLPATKSGTQLPSLPEELFT